MAVVRTIAAWGHCCRVHVRAGWLTRVVDDELNAACFATNVHDITLVGGPAEETTCDLDRTQGSHLVQDRAGHSLAVNSTKRQQ